MDDKKNIICNKVFEKETPKTTTNLPKAATAPWHKNELHRQIKRIKDSNSNHNNKNKILIVIKMQQQQQQQQQRHYHQHQQ